MPVALSVHGPSAAQGVGSAGGSAPPAAPSAGPVLPESPPLASVNINDALIVLTVAMAKDKNVDLKMNLSEVDIERQHQADAHEQLRAALQRMRDSEGGKGLFSSIEDAFTSVVRDVAELKLKDAALDFGKEAVLGCVGHAMVDNWDSPAFWHDLESAAQKVGDVASVVSMVPIPILQQVCMIVAISAKVTAGVAHAKNTEFEHDRAEANADATEARHAIADSQRATRSSLDDEKDANASFQRREEIAQDMQKTQNACAAAPLQWRA